MFDNYNQGTKAPYPQNKEEAENIVVQMVNMIHSEEVGKGLAQAIQGGQEEPVQVMAQLGAQLAAKVVKAIEQQTKRDILPETELGVLAIAVEELATLAANFGLNVDEPMVGNIVQIASEIYNKMVEAPQQTQAMPQQPTPQTAMGGM